MFLFFSLSNVSDDDTELWVKNIIYFVYKSTAMGKLGKFTGTIKYLDVKNPGKYFGRLACQGRNIKIIALPIIVIIYLTRLIK